MQTSIEIIEEIKGDAADLQRKLLSIPVPRPDGFNKEQSTAIVDAQDGLSFWRRMHLEILGKAFSEEG